MNNIPPWICHLVSAQKKESNISSSRWLQLATIGLDNSPRVRTVVFRGWSTSYEMKIYTDKRSQKYKELKLNNNVEICWFFSKAKSQFRFRGKSSIEIGKETLHYWNQINEESKSMWNWPCPGEDYVIDQKKIPTNTKDMTSKNFALLKIHITEVDQLLLHKPIHVRRRWRFEKQWIEKRINP
tara:strand:- start:48 stop:596 length:549 start_codon:yes stop_codon:yes gene_type:complete